MKAAEIILIAETTSSTFTIMKINFITMSETKFPKLFHNSSYSVLLHVPCSAPPFLFPQGLKALSFSAPTFQTRKHISFCLYTRTDPLQITDR